MMKFLISKIILSLLFVSVSLSTDQIEIGVDEQLGNNIPLDITFNDEDGNQVTPKRTYNRSNRSGTCLLQLPGNL